MTRPVQTYSFHLIVGEDFELPCDIAAREGAAFTISSASIIIYDNDGNVALTEKTDADGDFTMDNTNDRLLYQLDVNSADFEEGYYGVRWKWTDSTGQVMWEWFRVHVITVP